MYLETFVDPKLGNSRDRQMGDRSRALVPSLPWPLLSLFASIRPVDPLSFCNFIMSAATTISLSDTVAEILTKVGTWFPAIIALLALNAVVLLALAVVALIMCCRRRKPAADAVFSPRMRARSVLGRSSPMPMSESTTYPTGQTHVYEPVSMALTEDTLFGPPSPGFKDKFKRPQSYASTSRMSNVYAGEGSAPLDEPFTPPAPAFSRYEGDTLRGGERPNSVA